MLCLNLLNPKQSDIPFKFFTFPDGQPHLKLETADLNAYTDLSRDYREGVVIVARIANPSDLFTVLIAKDALESVGFDSIELTISYLMAARMDRQMTEGEPFSLRIVANMLNQAGFKRIRIFDPHSDVTTALLLRSSAISNEQFVKDCIEDFNTKNKGNVATMIGTERSSVVQDYWLVSPDAGALKKIHKVAQFVDAPRVAECMKSRDVKTGNLSGFKTMETDFDQKTCFIVDDICDGGGTFIGLAALLKSRNAGQVVLIVSHGIFSKGFDLKGIDCIYCTNSFSDSLNLNKNEDYIKHNTHVFSVEPYLNQSMTNLVFN